MSTVDKVRRLFGATSMFICFSDFVKESVIEIFYLITCTVQLFLFLKDMHLFFAVYWGQVQVN